MKLYSTNNKNQFFSLREAVLKGLPDDNGLFMPSHIPALPPDFLENIKDFSFPKIALTMARTLLQNAVPDADLERIIYDAINFSAPLVGLDEHTSVLELFHGPSLAFKDFGARFMAQLMSYFNQNADKELVILVATSGDTGGAVAAGFFKTLGIKVVILYPSGKVTPLQEKQLTTLGHNISALEINGTFDDCQALVKQAFLDNELTQKIRLSSANSINIARLIPQSFYYAEGIKQANTNLPVVFSIPSGNFGNLTAGLLAQKMGIPIHHFVAATNSNDVVPQFLASGEYHARPSVRTISNAMDVGNPSNFARMLDFYCSTWNNMKTQISGFAYDDDATRAAMKEVFEQHQYVMEPHGAIGYLALKEYQKKNPDTFGIILETAHPSKFVEDVEDILQQKIEIPERLAELAHRKKESIAMETDFLSFKTWLLDNF